MHFNMFCDRLLSFHRCLKEWLLLMWWLGKHHCKQCVSKVVLLRSVYADLSSPCSTWVWWTKGLLLLCGTRIFLLQYVSTWCTPAPHLHGPSRDPLPGSLRGALLSVHTVSARFGELQPYHLELTMAVSKGNHACLSSSDLKLYAYTLDPSVDHAPCLPRG